MFNRAILIGRLTADPELKQTPNGVSVTTFRIACNRSYTTKSGERQTDFINIVAWRNQAEFVTKYFRKGNAIGVEGAIQTREYTDKDGNKRTAFEVVGDNFFFVESKSAAASSGGTGYSQPSGASLPGDGGATYSSGDFGDFEEIEGEDDLPF